MLSRRGMAALVPVLLLAACTTPRGGTGFDALRFFDGRAVSQGTVTTAFVSTKAFTASFEGRREGEWLVLDERFRFPEGSPLQRWRLAARGEGQLGGTVETEGRSGALHAPVPVEGHATKDFVELSYDGYAPGGDTLLHFRHRMAMRPDGTVENRVRVSKYGLPLATSQVVFRRVPDEAK